MEYYAFKGPRNETVIGAVEEYDEENDRWKCKYLISGHSCGLWKVLPTLLWNIEYEITKEEFEKILDTNRSIAYKAQTF